MRKIFPGQRQSMRCRSVRWPSCLKRSTIPKRPFALGLWSEIKCLLKPAVSVTTLRKATGAYVHSRRHQIAMARPKSWRHDIRGKPVGSVSDADRSAAQQQYEQPRTGVETHKSKLNTAPVSKRELIRASLLGRSGAPG
ncbi:hypothetical protein IB277_22305 [Ensifer sp. ENS07]|nr:hypothetical protein [Ensifer sp. ENS07]